MHLFCVFCKRTKQADVHHLTYDRSFILSLNSLPTFSCFPPQTCNLTQKSFYERRDCKFWWQNLIEKFVHATLQRDKSTCLWCVWREIKVLWISSHDMCRERSSLFWIYCWKPYLAVARGWFNDLNLWPLVTQ